MKMKHYAGVGAFIASLAMSSVMAAPGGNSPFAAGFSGDVSQLPPGRLKEQIEKLPAAAQQRALEWLERFEIPTQDYEFLQVDTEGGIFYTDTVLPDEAPTASEATPTEAVAPEKVFLLHSRPGASKVVFLDFDGDNFSGTAWNSSYGTSTFYAPPFDTDGDDSSFNDSERAAIAAIWHRMAEDMAPFDIDVTTEDPGSFGPTTGHILITRDTDALGQAMPAQGAGGVAYVGVWGYSNYTYYQPALVYFNRLGSGYPHYVAEAASHEFGHNLGLSHDGTSAVGYYSGHGSGYVKWAPIMGVGYYSHVTQWSKGEYPDANNTQDDLTIISSRLGYRPDDHGGDLSSATALQTDANGILYVSTPELDPDNLDPSNKGVIETSVDTDMFWFDTAAGGVTFNVIPAWEAFYDDYRRGANLDIEATLYDEFGNFVAMADPTDETIAQLNLNLPAGRYYLEVRGVGNAVTPYSEYGSLGMYFISGTVQPVVSTTDTTPPSPNPMGWAVPPTAAGRTSISMTAQTATDESGVVEYMFDCTAGDAGCSFSGWQSGTTFVAAGLTPGATYTYTVQARDQYGNETAWSTMYSATTDANQLPVANNDSAVTDQDSSVSIPVLGNDTDGDGDSLSIAGFSQGANGSVSQSGGNLVYIPNAGFSGSDSFTYSVSDGFDVSGTATVTITVNAVSANSAPVATDDSASVVMNGTVLIDVLVNDSDPDGDSLSIVSYAQGAKGSVVLVGDQLQYTHGGKRGSDSFTYTIEDGQGGSATAIVYITLSKDGGSTGGSTGGGGKCNPKKGC